MSIAYVGFPHGLAGKGSACNAGDLGSIPEFGRSPETVSTLSSSISYEVMGPDAMILLF